MILLAVVVASTSSLALADKTWNGGGPITDAGSWTTALNWIGGSAPTPNSGEVLTFDGFAKTSNVNNFAGGSGFGGVVFAGSAGAFTLSGNQIALSGDLVDLTPNLNQTINIPLLLNSTINASVVTTGQMTLGGSISGAGGINKTGNGTIILGASNSFAGNLDVTAGTLQISADNNLGSTSSTLILEQNTTLRSANAAGTAFGFAIDPTRVIKIGPSSGSGAAIFDVFQPSLYNTGNATSGTYAGPSTVNFGGSIINNGGVGGLTKIGYGAMALSGSNTFSGDTTIRTGILRLDFSAAAAPTSNILYNGAATPGNLVIGGAVPAGIGSQPVAALVVTGKDATTTSQSFNSTLVDVGHGLVRVNAGATTSQTNLELGALSHNTGGNVTFLLPATSHGNVHATATNDNGILGGWALVSTTGTVVRNSVTPDTFATIDGSGNIQPYTGHIVYSTTDDSNNINLHSSTYSGGNIKIVGTSHSPISVQVDAPNANSVTDINTLTFTGATSDGDAVFIGAGNTLRLGKYGAVFRTDSTTAFNTFIGGTSDAPQPGSGAAGSQGVGILTAGGAANTPGEIHFIANSTNNNTGRMIVEATITDNGIIQSGPHAGEPARVTVIKSGTQGIKIDGHNTYTGGTYILEGIIQLAGGDTGTTNADGLGTGPVYVMPGAQFFANAATFPNDFFVAGIGTDQENFGVIRGTTNTILTGKWTLTGDTRLGARGASGAGTQFQNQITDNGNGFALTFGDGGATGAISLSNTTANANNWAGNTVVGFGTLLLGADNQIPDGPGKGNVQLNSSGTSGNISAWDLNGHSDTINGLTVVGNTTNTNIFVQNSTGSSILTLGGNDQTATFRGVIRDNGGVLGVTKVGRGLQTFTGANTYSGPTTINDGTLNIIGTMNTSSAVTASGGALAGIASVGSLTLSTGGTIAPGDRGDGAIATLNVGSFNNTGGGTLSIDMGATTDQIAVSGNATFAGHTTISTFGVPAGGTFTIVSSPNLTLSASPTFTVLQPPSLFGTRGAVVSLVDPTTTPGAIKLFVAGGAKTLTWTGGNGNWELVGASNWTGEGTTQQFFNGDLVNFLDGPTNRNVNLVGNLSPGTILVNNSQGNDYTFSGTGFISGGGGLFKDGAGTLTINTANTYSGQTTVNNGELLVIADTATTGTLQINGGSVQIGNGGTAGSLGTSPVNTGGNGLFVNRSDAFTVASAIGGGGQVFVNGTGTATFSGNNSFSGDLNILSGKVIANNSNSLGSTTGGSVQITAGAVLDLSGNNTANSLNFGTRQIHIRGAGPDGTGAIVNNGVSQQNAFQNITLEANATIGGTARFDLRNANNNPNLNLNNHTLTKLGNFQFSVAGGGDISSGTLDVQAGSLSIETSTNAPGGDLTSGEFIFRDGTALQLSAAAGNIERPMLFNGNTTIGTNSATASLMASNLTFDGPLSFTAFGNAATLSLTGNITELNGPRTLTKSGAGILALSGATAGWTGTTTISAGTLQLGTDNNTSAGSLGPGAVIDNANLVFNRGDTVSYPNAISGSGALFKTGFGTVTLAGNLSYTGPTGVSNGTLILTSGANTQSGVTTLDNANLVLAHTLAAQNSTINILNDNHLFFDGAVTSATIGGLAGPGSLNLTNQASATVNLTIKGGAGSSTVGYAGAINGAGSLTKIGVGTQVLSGNNNYTGVTQVQGGKLVLLGDNPRNVIFNNAGADITGGTLVFDFTTGTDPTSQVVSTLTTGFNQTPTKFATGPLRTSAATADKGLGYSTATPSQIAVFYTYYGDANGDGTVNMLDFNALATNFGGSGKGWSQGNFDYNATVDSADFNLLAGNFNKSLPVAPAPVLGTLVPEPASLGLVGFGLLAGLVRRRRR